MFILMASVLILNKRGNKMPFPFSGPTGFDAFVLATDAYFQYNTEDEGFLASDVATGLGIAGTVIGQVPYPATKVVGAALSGASAGIKAHVLFEGDQIVMHNPYHSSAMYPYQQKVNFYP